MDSPSLWQRYQDWLYFHAELGLYLDISRIPFDEAFIAKMSPKFERAFADIKALESGVIANPDENRMVGHYWLRAPELAPNAEIQASIKETIEQIEDFARRVHSGDIHPPTEPKFTDILSIGIGGSALGPQFVAEALAPTYPPMRIHFIDNTDSAGIAKTLERIGNPGDRNLKQRLSTTLVIVISKSGGTPETYNGMQEVKDAFEARGIDFAAHAVAITGKGSKLDKVAESDNWIARFPMFDWIGGRTSELSAVGLVDAALQGIDIRDILLGAKLMDNATRVPNLRDNPAALLAMCWYFEGNGKGEKDMVVLPYRDSLGLFSRYLQQLVMESLGKAEDLDGNLVNQGIAVYGNKGSTDQHAYVQQLREGVPNFFATFVEVLEDKVGKALELEPGVTTGDYLSAFLQGTRAALYDNSRHSITVTIPQVTPRHVGALIALYERAVSIYASLVNINAYHQPGVEAGKKMGASILNLQQKVRDLLSHAEMPLSIADVAQKTDGDPESVYKILRHLAANGRASLTGNWANPDTLLAAKS